MKRQQICLLALYYELFGALLISASLMARPSSHCQRNVETGLPLCKCLLDWICYERISATTSSLSRIKMSVKKYYTF